MPFETRLIAVCGVDGVGKSSLVAELERLDALPDCAYLRRPKTEDSNGALIDRYAPRTHGDGRDWLAGDFAQAMGIALAYDYLEFYHAAVRPLLGRKNFIVCDRYTLCFVAYLKSINSTFPVEAAYANVRRPDLTCYVQVPSHVHDVRLSQRGGRADDEHPDVSLNFHKAYMELLPSYSPRHHLIDNSGTLSHSVETMLAAMHKHFPDDFPLRL